MESTRPGDVLAGRYRLTDLLSESVAEARDGRFWKAHDNVLDRPVAIHVLAEDDARAPLLLDAARSSAMVSDPHLLRVLDADQRDGIVYIVNEWGSGTSLDNLLGAHGPIAPRRAAWVAGEVADTIASAHASGAAHGRLNPENVLLGVDGGVHVIGFAVDAALLGLTGDRRRIDLVDLAGLLYAMLTGRWAGESTSAVPAAPIDRGRVLRPRQVRAGVPRVLDDLCDSILGGTTIPAATFAATMRAYVGDPADLDAGVLLGTIDPVYIGPVEGPARGPATEGPVGGTDGTGGTGGTEIRERTAERRVTGAGAGAAEAADRDASSADTGADTDTGTGAGTDTPAGGGTGTGTRADSGSDTGADDPDAGPPTVAGVPSFEDTGDDGTPWFSPRPGRPTPPPPLEEPPARALFADEPRQPRYTEQPEAESDEPDPWIFSPPVVDVAHETEEPVPGRRWFRLAIGVAVVILLVIGILVGVHALQNGHHGASAPGSTSSPGGHTSPTAAATPITGLRARDFDPEGDPPEEYSELAHYAVDGDPSTVWHTSSYNDQIGHAPRSLKSGVGLVIDLGSAHKVSSVAVTVSAGAPTTMSIYLGADDPSGTPHGAPAATATGAGKVTMHPTNATGRYLTVWLTSLPRGSDGLYRGVIAEVAVTGGAAS